MLELGPRLPLGLSSLRELTQHVPEGHSSDIDVRPPDRLRGNDNRLNGEASAGEDVQLDDFETLGGNPK
jgi:hypothetical protein